MVMKRFLYGCLCLVGVCMAHAQQPDAEVVAVRDSVALEGPRIRFETLVYDFGRVKQGSRVERVFAFTNTGTEPLLLVNISTTCGCTAPSWPREPILPKEQSEIKVVFKTAGKVGTQNKAITVYSNTDNSPHILTLKGTVFVKE